jgi:hypothetical protein
VSQIDPRRGYLAQRHCRSQQANRLDVGLETGMAINFGTDLQGFASGIETRRQGVQHAAAVAQTRDTPAVEQVGIDASHLRRDIRTHSHAATGKLVHQLEGAQIEIVAATVQQRLDVLQQRRDDKLIAMPGKLVEQAAPQRLDARRIAWQDVLDCFRQEPAAICHDLSGKQSGEQRRRASTTGR